MKTEAVTAAVMWPTRVGTSGAWGAESMHVSNMRAKYASEFWYLQVGLVIIECRLPEGTDWIANTGILLN